ncbi:GumC family protein [Alistipes sp.]|uniref:GumC family protein n=1 Tax=Alistipes sp. TaxID=1872444 RepID=UPI003AB17F1D
MNYIAYTARFLYRIKWWLIVCPTLVALAVFFKMGAQPRTYKSTTTIYTGIVSGYDITSTEGTRQDWNVINNAMDNLINIILSQSTLKNVSIRLYAQDLTHLDTEKDNKYLTARTSRYLKARTPDDVMALVDPASEEKTLENLRNYEKADHDNHVYGIFHWSPPYYSYDALSRIKVRRVASSDMLEISYENDDPYIVYNTLLILNDEFVKQYRDLRFGETNNVIAYFESELDRVGRNLRNLEDSLRDYNVEHKVINYDEQTKHIAALSRDYELRYEEILLNFESAEKLRTSIEQQLEGLQTFHNNTQFIEKLHSIGNLYSRLSAAEAFQPTPGSEPLSDKETLPTSRSNVGQLRQKLDEETRSLQQITTNIANQQYTKEGLSTTSIIGEWLAAVLLAEKSKAELGVMKLRKGELDEKYVHFSPVGSTLKRKGREINFSEQSYLSILSALNAARLRQKNLQMTSATLKIINAPVLPIAAEPYKRKLFVAAAFLATMLFVLGFFILLELLDRTLRDKVRAERITGGRVIGAFPGKGRFGQRRFTKQYREIAARYIGNAAINYFEPSARPNVLNILSTEHGDGKSLIIEYLADFFREANMKVRVVEWNRDFDIEQKSYLLAEKLEDFVQDKPDQVPFAEADVVLVEYPPLTESSIPKELLRHAALDIVIAPANRTWKDTDQLLFEKVEKLAGRTPVTLCLNCARRDVVQSFTGLMPPYGRLRRLGYQISQFGFTAVK